MNRDLLREAIKKSGMTKRHIAQRLGVTEQGLENKISGKTDFKMSEANCIVSVLHLTANEANCIFFADSVELN